MEISRNFTTENVHIFTTEEVIQNQVKNLVHTLMDEGKDGPTHGWVMSDILSEVSERFGRDMVDFAKRHIVVDVCGIKEPHVPSRS